MISKTLVKEIAANEDNGSELFLAAIRVKKG